MDSTHRDYHLIDRTGWLGQHRAFGPFPIERNGDDAFLDALWNRRLPRDWEIRNQRQDASRQPLDLLE